MLLFYFYTPWHFIKKRLEHLRFIVNFSGVFKNTFLIEHMRMAALHFVSKNWLDNSFYEILKIN